METFSALWPFVHEFSGHHWIARTKAIDVELWCFWSAAEQMFEQKNKMPVIWDVIVLIMTSV